MHIRRTEVVPCKESLTADMCQFATGTTDTPERCALEMADDVRRQLAKALGLPANDPVLDQLLDVLNDWQAREVTVDEAKLQLEQDPKLHTVQSLVSFEGAHAKGGLTSGDVAGNNIIKLQNFFIILPNNGGGKIPATQPKASSVIENKTDEDPKQLDMLSTAIACYKDIKSKQRQLLPLFLLFNVIRIENIPAADYELVARSPLIGIEDIWPEHCELALVILQEMIQPVQKFYDLLDKALAREFTSEVIRLRSSLMTPLRIIRSELTELISLFTRLSKVCRTVSFDVISLRREIKEKLTSLQENLNEVKNPMDI